MEVTIENNIKKMRSENYNYNFSLANGYFERWGKTERDDPTWAPYGPEILDIEVTTKCSGVSGHLCKYCYKANTPNGKNMSLETFKKVIEKINYNNQLTQVAFGLGSTAEENPDIWNMCNYLRSINVIPNGTVAEISDETAEKIARCWGAVAVSYHSDWEVLCNTVEKLTRIKDGTLKQVNIHYMICEETYDDCLKLFEMIKTDKRLKDLNAVVLLGLKKCGRAIGDNFNRLSDEKFKTLVKTAFEKNIGFGFDSCSANRFLTAVNSIGKEKISAAKTKKEINEEINKLLSYHQSAEPCESFGLFSSYVDVDGIYHPCSFCPGSEKYLKEFSGFNLLENKFSTFWIDNSKLEDLRQRSIKNNRSCLFYEV